MDANIDESHINITFGPAFQNSPPSSFNFNLLFNSSEVETQSSKISQISGGELDGTNSLIFVFTCDSLNQSALEEAIKELVDNLLNCGCLPVPKEAVNLKIVRKPGKLLVALSPQGDIQEKLVEVKGMADGFGVTEISKNQKNSMTIEAQNRGFADIANDVRNGHSFMSAFLNQCKLSLRFLIDRGLADAVRNVCSNLDPTLESTPPLLFLTYFQRLNLDFKFNSTKELPEVFLKYLLSKKKIRNMSAEDKKLKGVPANCEKVLEILDSNVDVYFSLAELVAVNASFSAENFVSFIKEFGGAAKALI